MAYLMPYPKQRYTDANGLPLAGGKLYFYAAGTSTPLATYSDSSGTLNTNPVILDANGEAVVWISSASYKLVLKNASDVTQWTADDVQAIPNQSIDKTKIAANVANHGLLQEADGSLSVDYDDVTVTVDGATDRVKVKSAGIDTLQLKDSSVTTPKIADGAVTGPKIGAGAISSDKMAAANIKTSGIINHIDASASAAIAQTRATSTSYNIISISRASNIVTVTMGIGVSMTVGEIVYISGSTGSALTFNGAFVVLSSVSGSPNSTITFAQTGTNESGTPSTGLAAQYTASNGTATCQSLVRAANIVTATTTFAHGLQVGQVFSIVNSAGGATSFNGSFVVSTTPTSTTFTYAQTGPSESATALYGNVQGWAAVLITATGRPVRLSLLPGANVLSNIAQDYISQSGSHGLVTIGICRKSGSTPPTSAVDYSQIWQSQSFTPPGKPTVVATWSSTGLGTTTITFNEPHGLSIGDAFWIVNTGSPGVNGVWTVASVPSYLSIGYQSAAGAVSGTGGAVFPKKFWVKHPSELSLIDTPAAGTYIYFLTTLTNSVNDTIQFSNCAFTAMEV